LSCTVNDASAVPEFPSVTDTSLMETVGPDDGGAATAVLPTSDVTNATSAVVAVRLTSPLRLIITTIL
jgi:hypothetical protein